MSNDKSAQDIWMKVILQTRDKIAKERAQENNKLELLASEKKDEYEREAT